jgi:DNA-binding MarR family transcriptional regulator
MSKKRRDAKHIKKYRLPGWIRNKNFRVLNRSQKDFLGYLYCFGPDTCWLWNWRLAKEFGVTKRTIRRWLRALREHGFVWIEKPFGPERKIHARAMLAPEHWVKMIATLSLSSGLRKHRRRRQRPRSFPPAIQNWHSPAFIEQARHDIISELVHRGETFETASKVADIVIAKSREKKGDRGGQKCPP